MDAAVTAKTHRQNCVFILVIYFFLLVVRVEAGGEWSVKHGFGAANVCFNSPCIPSEAGQELPGYQPPQARPFGAVRVGLAVEKENAWGIKKATL